MTTVDESITAVYDALADARTVSLDEFISLALTKSAEISDQGHQRVAEAIERAVLAIGFASGTSQDVLDLLLVRLAQSLTGDASGIAESLLKHVIERHRESRPVPLQVLRYMGLLGSFYNADNRHTEAEEIFRRTLALAERDEVTDIDLNLLHRNNLALSLIEQRRLVEATKIVDDVLIARTERLGVEHPDTIVTGINRAAISYDSGDITGATRRLTLLRNTMVDSKQTQLREYLMCLNHLAKCHYAVGDIRLSHGLIDELRRVSSRLSFISDRAMLDEIWIHKALSALMTEPGHATAIEVLEGYGWGRPGHAERGKEE